MTQIATTWSYSRWDTWRQCPLKYKLTHLDKLDKEQSPAMIRGNRLHISLAHYIEGKQAEMPVEVKDPAHRDLYAAMRAFPNKMVEQQWGFTEKWKATGWFGKDTWFRAILDVALFYEDDEVEAIDHKSGKRYGSNDDQMELFGFSVMCRVPSAKNVVTRLIYFDQPGLQIIHEFPVKDREKLAAKWAELARPMLADRAWPARPNDKCGWCPFGRDKGGQCIHG